MCQFFFDWRNWGGGGDGPPPPPLVGGGPLPPPIGQLSNGLLSGLYQVVLSSGFIKWFINKYNYKNFLYKSFFYIGRR